jgi:replicative superfamily II helicase
MVDFRKKLNKAQSEKKVNPLEIYDSLDRRSVAGPLRPAQQKILEDWFNNRSSDKDLIVKLHTGEGKTLIGLLILLSKLNSGKSPCMFVCPNIYLVQQVIRDAKKFGIPFCTVDEDGTLPNDFLDGIKILITHVQKVFNGKTKFGLGNDYIHVENIILDDSHACIDAIKNTFTINLKSDHKAYAELLELFKDTLPNQGEGTFLEIKHGDFDSFLPIPYWNWIDKSAEILEILSKYREENSLAFAWPFIKDNIKSCQAYISGQTLEITPIHIPIEKFSTFHNAGQRILMSATTQDDSFFIKGLGFDLDAIKNPLHNPTQIWSGEKMLVIPSLIDESLDRISIINAFAKSVQKKYGVISLTPSFSKSEIYKELGSLVPKSSEIVSVVNHLKRANFDQTVVFANRYDGIDLPDETCRILLFDGVPFINSLADRYEESNRLGSDFSNIKIAQKIEQGLGRSVRGEKDYCLILIIGPDLVKFIKSSRTKKYFSQQTQKQIEIGMEIAHLAADEVSEKKQPFEVVKSLIKQSLLRDDGWKEFYKEEMNKINPISEASKIYEILTLERIAATASYAGDFEKASNTIQIIIDKHCEDESEKAWYIQIMARYKYFVSKNDSNSLQKSAFLKNHELLIPSQGITYKKINFINENRIKRIQVWIKKHKNFEDLTLSVDGVLSDLEFGVSADKFEVALKEVGLMLGFISERPDKEIKKGPDNLWCGVSNEYLLFECKNEVNIDRKEINKHEVAQMNSHCGWFESQYAGAEVKRIMIIPTKNVSYHGDFTHEVEIMRRSHLKNLRSNIKAFFKEFSKYEIDSVENEKLQELINLHKLDINSIKEKYSEKYFKKAS